MEYLKMTNMKTINIDNAFSSMRKNEAPLIQIDNGTQALAGGLEILIGDYQWLPAYDHVASWLKDNKKKGLLLIGGNGTGKTTIAKILLNIFKSYFFEEIPQDSIAFTSAYNITSAISKYHKVQVIDDVGVESSFSEFGVRQDYFTQIVDKAEQSGQILVCTSNLLNKELKEKYGDRTFDRMKAIMSVVLFEGQSMRK